MFLRLSILNISLKAGYSGEEHVEKQQLLPLYRLVSVVYVQVSARDV